MERQEQLEEKIRKYNTISGRASIVGTVLGAATATLGLSYDHTLASLAGGLLLGSTLSDTISYLASYLATRNN